MMEFHISRKARDRYQFAESLFSYSGNVVFANLAACREFAQRMNTVRDVERHPERVVHAGQLYAMGLIDEASHVLMARYREQFDPQVMTGALEWFAGKVGADAMGKLLLTFVEQFPGMKVMRGEQTPAEWLEGQTEGTPHWAVAFEELILLWTANRNEAFHPFKELFEEKSLAEKTVYRKVTRRLPEYFATRPLIPLPDAKPMNLLELLRAPAVGAPRSLSDQLALIQKLWRPLIGDSLERFLLIAGEVLREEELAIWKQFNPPDESARRRRESGRQQWPGVVSTAQVPEFGDQAHEYEKFSPDQAWMPTAVLIAKSTYVWMAQMSRQYGRWIKRLDEIPDEELATLAHRGLNTLWLIGIWERSRASKTIKQLCGNSDAVASAYSLFDYTIADDLGGETAYVNLRDRAYKFGIRLASDMVPNHMGIDSPWVVEHPDWFISRPEPPYPAYSFNGPDLSQDGRVEIKIEDHYYEQSDAAVVFQRRDRSSGETRYIYHGNDGTSFPWNDTAQLDYMNPAVREQVIQTILHVARLFPVIRFDAAMTLAKRHFHRLWFPGPGSSGAIPSRAEYGMSQAEFNNLMPHEFWREVVDRVAAEVPNTLLLAEAFWLMEGYFVRTLGMHRVYNSAFMVMLRDEDNANYRSVIKKTLEFDPDIMKRYVNFMSNPDERTAIDQFGKGDKCFGVATMMATLPGLPMFGHGQIEGFTEKYGMEYQRPRYEENPDPSMVKRHEREIAPLLKRRRLFAESDNFLLYDFFTDAGKVDENVFAYSNRNGNERALVVFNNRYGETHGTIDYSTAYADKGASQLRQQRIGEGLGIGGHSGAVLAWRDSLTGLEYLRRASDLYRGGLRLDLHAYQCFVFVDWCELYSTQDKPWDRLADHLAGRGVPSLEDALVNLELQPVHDALRALLDPGMVRLFAGLAEHPRTLAVGVNPGIEAERAEFFAEAWGRCESFMRVAQKACLASSGGTGKLAGSLPANPGLLGAAFRARLRAAMRMPSTEALFPAPWPAAARRVLPSPSPQLTATAVWGPVFAWCALELLAESFDAEKPEPAALELFDRLRLREPLAQVFTALGFEGEEAWRVAARVKVGMLAGAGAGKPEEAGPAKSPGETKRPETHADRSKVSEHDLTDHAEIQAELSEASGPNFTDRAETQAEPSEVSGHDFSRAESTLTSLRALDAPAGEVQAALPESKPEFEEKQASLSPALWQDPDVRWLTGVHLAEGREYLVREPYEELLWWLLMPSLLRLAAETGADSASRNRAAVASMSKGIHEALAAVEAAGYRVDRLIAPGGIEAAQEEPASEAASAIELVAEAAAEPAAGAVALVAAESELAAEEPAAQPVAESAPEAVVETAAEPEITTEAEIPELLEEPEPVELESEAAPEPAVELTAEAVAEPALELVAEPASEAVVETAAEPELPAEAEVPEPVEEPELVELESEAAPVPAFELTAEAVEEPATELVAEPASEAVVETAAEPELSAEAEFPEPVEEPELVELESEAAPEPAVELTAEVVAEPAEELVAETASEAVVETAAEPELPTESEASEQVEEPEPAGLENEAAFEAEPEAAIEAVEEPVPEAAVAVDAEPEPLAAEAAPAEELQPVEPESEAPSEPAAEALAEAVADPELSAEAEPSVPVEPVQPVEPETEPETEAAFEPTTEPVLESAAEVEPETTVETVAESPAEAVAVEAAAPPRASWPLSAGDLESTEPVSAAEFVPSLNQEPVESTAEPGFRLTDYLVAKAEAMPETEPPVEPAVGPVEGAKARPSLAERWESLVPKIEFAAKPVDEPRTVAEALSSFAGRWEPPAQQVEFDSKPAAGAGPERVVLPSLTERWEPPAPQIEFVAKSPAEAKTEGEAPPALAERWEPQTAKSDIGTDALAEPRSLAELILSLNERWEPLAPKIEFAAKPAAEVSAEAAEWVSHPELLRPAKREVDPPEEPVNDPDEST